MDEETNKNLQKIFRTIQKSTEPINKFINSQAYQNIIEQQKEITKLANRFVNSSFFKDAREAQEKFSKVAEGLLHSQVFHDIIEQQKEIAKITNHFINSQDFQRMREQQSEISRVMADFSNIQFIKDIDLDNIQLDSEEFKDIIESQDGKISDNEKEIINDFLEVSEIAFPEISVITKHYEDRNYKKTAVALIRFMIIYFFISYQVYIEFIDIDKHYKVNRDNVRVRMSPQKDNSNNIITKLSKNTYIERIGSDNGWVKVRFELEDGVEKEGWIFRTMITKMD